MPLDPALAGRTFAPTAPYTVSRQKIAEFTAAISSEPIDGGSTAPLTFPIVVAFGAMTSFMADPAIGIELRNVVHGDQRFEQVRPIAAGDELVATLTVDSVRSAGGMDMIATRTQISTTGGDEVCTASALLLHRGGT